MSERPRILVTQRVPDAAYTLLEAVGEVDANMEEGGRIWSPEELLQHAPGHDYIFCLLTDTIDERLLEVCSSALPGLKQVSIMAVGYNNTDIAAATRLGIAVTNTPGVLTDTSADLAFGLLLAVARRIPEAERYMRAGKYTGWGPLLLCGTDVHSATLGIIGAGRIGLAVAKRAQGFDMTVLYHNRKRLSQQEEEQYGLIYTSLDELLQRSDFVSIHAPYTPETHHLISEREFALMKPSAMLINTARGPIVDEKALVQALQNGQLAGAGLDVFEHEPHVEPELLTMEQVVLVPHIASASLQTRTLMATMASENIVAHIRGIRPPNIINAEVL
ncbi:MAG TPA: D-glycerate dehydrogenase [Ktedonobacter sp.]|nr:D-glycerate dehydrogenase [Ktedonobacter sp.]